MFIVLRRILEDIWNGDSDMSWETFHSRVETAYTNDEITGTEYDWLINNMEVL